MRSSFAVSTAFAVILSATAAQAVTFNGTVGNVQVSGDNVVPGSASNMANEPVNKAYTGTTQIQTLDDNPTGGWNPFGSGNGNFLTVRADGNGPGTASYVFDQVISKFSFIWGSFDPGTSANVVSFYKTISNVSTLVGKVTGDDLVPMMSAAVGGGSHALFTNNSHSTPAQRFLAAFNVTGGFDKVVLSNDGFGGFEVSHVAAGDKAVPGPVAGAGLPFLLAAGALWMRRRNGCVA